MKDFKNLIARIHELKNNTCFWYSELSENIREQYEEHNQYVLDALEKLLSSSLPEEDKIKQLRYFLYSRGIAIVGSSMCYTRNVQLPANIVCVLAAKIIACDDEPIVKILLPTIQKVIGWFPSEEIKAATEEDDHFDPSAFLVNKTSDALLSIPSIFQYAISNTDVLFSSFNSKKESEKVFNLTEADRQLLKSFLGEKSEALYQALYAVHLMQHDEKPSVRTRLRDLKDALYQGSDIGTGSDALANEAEYIPAIKTFYNLFRGWSASVKARFMNTSNAGSSDSIGVYLLYLFARIPDVTLTEDEMKMVLECDIPVNCAHFIAEHLDCFLKQNPLAFNIPLTIEGYELLEDVSNTQQQIASPNELTQMYHSLIQELHKRPTIAGNNDLNCIERLVYLPLLLNDNFAQIISQINRAEQLGYLLSMIPTEQWNQLSTLFSSKFNIIFRSHRFSINRQNSPFIVILDLLPETLWNKFFDSFSVYVSEFFSYAELHFLFFKLPEYKYRFLINSMGNFIDVAFSHSEFIAEFFCAFELNDWAKLMTIFKMIIVKRLSSTFDFGTVIFNLPEENQKLFFHLLNELDESILKNALQGAGKLTRVLDLCTEESKFSFLCVLGSFFESSLTHWYELFMVLSVTPVQSWLNICSKLLNENDITRLIPNSTVLMEFLKQFRKEQHEPCINAIEKYLPVLLKTYEDIYQMITEFPNLTKSFLKALQHRLPYLITELLKRHFDCIENHTTMLILEQNLMKQLIMLGIPILFSKDNVEQLFKDSKQYAPTFFNTTEDQLLSQFFRKLDKISDSESEIITSPGLMRFLSCCEFVLNDEVKTLRGGFYNVLIHHFGKEFFVLVKQYLVDFQQPVFTNEMPVSSLAHQLH